MIDAGHNLKAIRERFKARGVYYTPPELAQMIASYVPASPASVYDPTCGDGALLSVFSDDVAKFGQEIDPSQALIAREGLVNADIRTGDTLADDQFPGMVFDAIVANPPFSIRWEPQADERFTCAPAIPTASRADFAFLLHILAHLSETGTAAVLSFPGVLYRGGREGQIRCWLVEQNVISRVVAIPGDTFIDTPIATAIIVLERGRTSTDVVFEDREHGIERTVPVDEIRGNDFILSVSHYVQPPQPEAEPVDACALELAAREQFIRKLKADLEFSRIVCEIEGWNYAPYIDALERVIAHERDALEGVLA